MSEESRFLFPENRAEAPQYIHRKSNSQSQKKVLLTSHQIKKQKCLPQIGKRRPVGDIPFLVESL